MSAELTLDLTPALAFDFDIAAFGRPLAPFRVTSRWNGLTELRNDLGWTAVVSIEIDGVPVNSQLLIARSALGSKITARVVTTSPVLLSQLLEARRAASEEREEAA